MKKIIGILKTRNEGDIIESFCRYNLTFCDAILVYEGKRSFDSTREILEKIVDEGLPVYLLDDVGNTESKNILAIKAIEEFGADLVVVLDTDEFLYHTDGINPRKALEELKEDVEYQIPWRTYVYQGEPKNPDVFMPSNFTHYRNPLLDRLKKAVMSKYLLQKSQVRFSAGGHYLESTQEYRETKTVVNPSKLVYAHFPVRSKSQIMLKAIPNWINKWKPPFPARKGQGFQVGLLYDEIKKSGDLSHEKIMQHSIEYSVREAVLKDIWPKIKNNLIIEGSMDVSYCADKLILRYTKPRKDAGKNLMRAVLKEVDTTIEALVNIIDESGIEI